MAVTLSEKEKKSLDELFVSIREKKRLHDRILSAVLCYILELKRKNKRNKQHQ